MVSKPFITNKTFVNNVNKTFAKQDKKREEKKRNETQSGFFMHCACAVITK